MEPSSAVSSSEMILTICWPGWTLAMTSAERLGLDAFDEIARDLEIDVGFEECHADFAQGVGGVALGNFAEAAQIFEGVLEFAA